MVSQSVRALHPQTPCSRCVTLSQCVCCCCFHLLRLIEGGDPSLEDILASDLGVAYFREHLRREYSEENLLCVKVSLLALFDLLIVVLQSIDSFARQPSYRHMHDILDRFVRPGSPLEINIDFQTRCDFVFVGV